MDRVEKLLEEAFGDGVLISLVLSDSRKTAPEAYRKVSVKPVLIRGQQRYQFEYHQDRKVVHRNLPAEEALAHTRALLAETFLRGQFRMETADAEVRIDKHGKVSLHTRPPSQSAPDLRHDRQKPYLLPDNQPCDFLIRLGVMAQNGKVIAARYDKFRQINRFLEMVADVADSLPQYGPIRVVDFGCGKAYLTFALYHYLRHLKGRDVQIVGLDLKQDVVAHCNEIAHDLGDTGLSFRVGEIKNYTSQDQEPVDMVVSLHACDTATDDTLARAVQWGAQVILSVPCCQHELFRQIQNETLRPLLKHGLLKERLTALVTDSLRAQMLEIAGYSVQLLEFVETEHTPKNLLIRAVRRDQTPNRDALIAEYRAYRDFWHLHPYIETAFGGLPDAASPPSPLS